MPKIQRSALVRFSAERMFDLVDDIEAYENFLPWCESSKVLRRQDEFVEAKLNISGAGIKQSFTTRNTHRGKQEMRMDLVDGPFKKLHGVWSFLPLREDACKVTLDLEFELSGTLSSLAFGAVFSRICNTLVSAFSQRAKDLYGKP